MSDTNERSVASTGSVDALAGDRETTGSLTHDDIMAEADQFIRDDRSGWTLVYKMRAEIARLRLTDTDKNAIRLGELAFPGLRMTDKGKFVDVWATLRGLVERQNRIVCDTKMDTTPGDGAAQNEGSVPSGEAPLLTSQEREAVASAYSRLTADTHYAAVAATLLGLLERTK